MVHLFEYKYWAIQISAYLFFTCFLYFSLKAVSTYKYSKKLDSISVNKDLYLLIIYIFLFVLICFSSFRYIRFSIDEFNTYQGRYYFIGGNDTCEYRYCYKIAKGESFSYAKEMMHKEFIFSFIFWFFSNLNIPFDLCLAFFNCLMGIAIIKYAKIFDLRKDSFLSILALCALYLGSFNTLRWSFNLIFTIYFVNNFLREKYFRCIIVMLFCVGFQFSALVYVFPLVGILFMKKNRKLGYFYFLVCCFICWAPALLDISPFLKAIGRLHQADVSGNKPSTWFAMYSVYCANLFMVRKTFFKNRQNKMLFYLILFLIPPTFIELSFGLAYRFSYYAHPILYMHLVYLNRENKKYGYKGLFFIAIEAFLILTIILKFYFGEGIESSGVPYIFNKYLLIK